MRPRAFRLIAEMSSDERQRCLAEGLAAVGEHVITLASDAAAPDLGSRGGLVLDIVATEEAGKFLALLDAVRCLSRSQDDLARQLKYCSDHVAKGIYAQVIDILPANLREVAGYVDLLRRGYYLDGPNDDDWIFRNEIEAAREEQMYVDLVESDEGTEWWSPKRFDRLGRSSDSSAAAEIVGALVRCGVATAPGIEAMVRHWESLEPDVGPSEEELFEGLEGLPIEDRAKLARERDTSTTWKEVADRVDATLAELDAAGVSTQATAWDRALIRERWGFPLYALDLRKAQGTAADVERLRALRRSKRVEPLAEGWADQHATDI